MAACRGRHVAGETLPPGPRGGRGPTRSARRDAMRSFSLATAAGTLAAIGLATPLVVALLLPGLPLALAAVAVHQWRERGE